MNTTGQYGGLFQISTDMVLRSLYNKGKANFTHADQWFGDFADAMTNKLRSQYGSARDSRTDVLALTNQSNSQQNTAARYKRLEYPAHIKGLTWQTTSCVSVH